MQPDDAEWRLVTSAPAAATPAAGSSSSGSSSSVAAAVVAGEYEAALSSAPVLALLAPLAARLGAHLSAAAPGAVLALRVAPAASSAPPLELLAAAVAALHAFVRLNWTGPALPAALTPLALLRRAAPAAFPPRDAQLAEPDAAAEAALRDGALDALTRAGEPAYHLCTQPAWLVVAQHLLACIDASLPSDAGAARPLPTLAWWQLRAASISARILDVHGALDAGVLARTAELAAQLHGLADTAPAWRMLRARLLVELGLAHQREGNDKAARDLFVDAAQASGLRYEITGAPGRQTKWQQEDRNQLVLLAESSAAGQNDGAEDAEASSSADADVDIDASTAGKAAALPVPKRDAPPESGWKSTVDEALPQHMPASLLLNDDTLLERTRFTSSEAAAGREGTAAAASLAHLDPGNPPPLSPVDSCILLALSLDIRNTSPAHGLLASQIAVFVARVLVHPRNWSVHTMGLLLRSRLESTRTRTAERGVLQLQALLDQMPSTDSSARERLALFHALDLPSAWEMRAELAHRYAELGVVRSALEIFESIELWEDVVACLGALGRSEDGRAVVVDLLKGSKVEAAHVTSTRKRGDAAPAATTRARLNSAREAKLWCLLGDLEPDCAIEHYTRAWDVSSSSSARAARSLGALYYGQNEYSSSVIWLRRALRIAPLFSRSWFVLGCALMRDERFSEAAAAFRRAGSLEEDDAESWNNLASCYLRMGADEGAARAAAMAETGAGGIEAHDRALGLGPQATLAQDEADEDARTITSGDTSRGADSGVDVSSEPDLHFDDDADAPAPAAGRTPYELRLLAHRALARAVRFGPDNWRVWENYMMVSLDAGFLSEASQALARLIELRVGSSRDGARAEQVVDMDVLRRLVDGVTRAPYVEEPGTLRNPNEGHGLATAVQALFDRAIFPRVSPWPALWQTYARLCLWRGDLRLALDSHLKAWTAGPGDPANEAVTRDRKEFAAAVEQLLELGELLENFGPRTIKLDDGSSEPAMSNWAFRARSLVRSFMGRTKDVFEDDAEWTRLEEMRDSLKGA